MGKMKPRMANRPQRWKPLSVKAAGRCDWTKLSLMRAMEIPAEDTQETLCNICHSCQLHFKVQVCVCVFDYIQGPPLTHMMKTMNNAAVQYATQMAAFWKSAVMLDMN